MLGIWHDARATGYAVSYIRVRVVTRSRHNLDFDNSISTGIPHSNIIDLVSKQYQEFETDKTETGYT